MNIQIEVFNRWGMVVYQNGNYNNNWDGKGTGAWNNKELEDGTYYYIINAKDNTSGITKNFIGFLTLKR